MMRSRRLYAQKKVLFWLGSSWRKTVLPKRVNDAIWKRANDVLSCEEHERQINSDASPFEQNIKVPDGFRVRMGGLWLIELFPSSLSDALLKQLDKSGWDGVHAYAVNRDSNSEKAREARAKENIGWWRLGHDVDKGFHGFAPNAVSLDLPHGFESVEYNAIQIGSSLTAISAFFSPTEELRTKLDAEWHAEHEPILLKQRGKRPRALSRRENDMRATQLARNEAYEKARNWLARRCGGFFSAIQARLFLYRHRITTIDLGPTSQPRADIISTISRTSLDLFILCQDHRARAYYRHPFCQDEKTRLPAEMLRLDS